MPVVRMFAATATLPAGHGPARPNLFASPPSIPSINDAAPLHLPVPSNTPSSEPSPATKLKPRRGEQNRATHALRASHTRTHYHKPIPTTTGENADTLLSSDADGRAVVVGRSGVSYRLPGAPFDFQYSYSETPRSSPVAIREPAFLPFAPRSMPRPWTGKAPLLSKKEKQRKRGMRLFRPLGSEEEGEVGQDGLVMETRGKRPIQLCNDATTDERSREEVLGPPLSPVEVKALVRPHLSHNRQLNLGRDGLTHNMLEMIHCHWRRQEVCKVRCRGVPTVDMNNICYHLEEKSGGKVIYRTGGIVYLFRGRNYDPRHRPRYPVMLWKPAAPVYPKLIQEAPEGLTKAEADEMRRKGQQLLPICKLAKNGIYITLVKEVRNAFECNELVKIDCQGMHASDYKKLGAKLKELVPCVLLSFDGEQILIWRGKDWKSRYSRYPVPIPHDLKHTPNPQSFFSNSATSVDTANDCTDNTASATTLLSLWSKALRTSKALLLPDPEITPDLLLNRVEEFTDASQAAEHSYPAKIVADGQASGATHNDQVEAEADKGTETSIDRFTSIYSLEGTESIPCGLLPVDELAERLQEEGLSEMFRKPNF